MRIHNYDFYKTQNNKKKNEKKTHEMGGKSCAIKVDGGFTENEAKNEQQRHKNKKNSFRLLWMWIGKNWHWLRKWQAHTDFVIKFPLPSSHSFNF